MTSVAAVDRNLHVSYFSNANAGVDLSAPGEDVLTAVPVSLDADDGIRDGYAAVDGTSFAAPIVAATAAWVQAARPGLTGDQVQSVLTRSARDLGGEGWDQHTGHGLVDVAGALTALPPTPDHSEPNDDVEWVNGKFLAPIRSVYRRGKGASLNASLDQWKDPADVYRVTFPARRTLRVRLAPRFGDPDLFAYRTGIPTVEPHDLVDRIVTARGLVAASRRRGDERTDTIFVTNRSRRSQRGYVVVRIQPSVRVLNASYRLSIKRLRKQPRPVRNSLSRGVLGKPRLP